MSKKKLVKKLIIVLLFYGIALEEKLQKMFNIATAHAANATLVPGLTPAPSAILTKIAATRTLISNRDALAEQMKSITQQITDNVDDLTNTYVSEWATQTQNAGITEANALLLGYSVKGKKEAVPLPENSAPLIKTININVHSQHTISIINTLSGKTGLPEGVLRIDVYGQTGGTRPADLAALMANGGGYLGQASRGKFVYNFNVSKPGDVEYYIAVYVDKTTKKPIRFSMVESGVLV